MQSLFKHRLAAQAGHRPCGVPFAVAAAVGAGARCGQESTGKAGIGQAGPSGPCGCSGVPALVAGADPAGPEHCQEPGGRRGAGVRAVCIFVPPASDRPHLCQCQYPVAVSAGAGAGCHRGRCAGAAPDPAEPGAFRCGRCAGQAGRTRRHAALQTRGLCAVQHCAARRPRGIAGRGPAAPAHARAVAAAPALHQQPGVQARDQGAPAPVLCAQRQPV